MVTFCGWGWREKQKDILQKQSPGRVLQERSSKIFGKAYRPSILTIIFDFIENIWNFRVAIKRSENRI